jgi:hypothetical protein
MVVIPSFIMFLLILFYNCNTAGCKAMVSDHALLKQRYHILGKVGEGGFGAVYRQKTPNLITDS